jgi:hypothetical protein
VELTRDEIRSLPEFTGAGDRNRRS